MSYLLRFLPVLLVTITFLSSCKKGGDSSAEPNENIPDTGKLSPLKLPMVKTIRWAVSGTEYYTYNADSTLKQTLAESYGASTVSRDFIYEQKRLVRILKSNIKEEIFAYDNAGRVSSIVEKQISSDFGNRLEFQYNDAGLVTNLNYFTTEGTHSTLKQTSVYNYDTQKRLLKITTTAPANPGYKWTLDFENHSEELYINPWSHLEPWQLIDINYTFYNCPVLSTLKNLPGKIISKQELNGVLTDTKTQTYEYEIKNKFLLSITHTPNSFKVTYEY